LLCISHHNPLGWWIGRIMWVLLKSFIRPLNELPTIRERFVSHSNILVIHPSHYVDGLISTNSQAAKARLISLLRNNAVDLLYDE